MMALEPWWNDLAHPEIAEAAKANQDWKTKGHINIEKTKGTST